MADRKVLIKYYPPDFDPKLLAQKGRFFAKPPAAKRHRNGAKLMNVRFMFPFTMCCGMCKEFIYIGTKFNSRIEKIQNENYLNIPIWRFYARCPHCRAEIVFKTDPKHTEYVLESGGTRTYDPRKDAELAEKTLKEKLHEEISTDSNRALEHKSSTTANELQALDQLDELRRINKRLLKREATIEQALEWLKSGGVEKDEELEAKRKAEIEVENEIELYKESKEAFEALRLLGAKDPNLASQLPHNQNDTDNVNDNTDCRASDDHLVNSLANRASDDDHSDNNPLPESLSRLTNILNSFQQGAPTCEQPLLPISDIHHSKTSSTHQQALTVSSPIAFSTEKSKNQSDQNSHSHEDSKERNNDQTPFFSTLQKTQKHHIIIHKKCASSTKTNLHNPHALQSCMLDYDSDH